MLHAHILTETLDTAKNVEIDIALVATVQVKCQTVTDHGHTAIHKCSQRMYDCDAGLLLRNNSPFVRSAACESQLGYIPILDRPNIISHCHSIENRKMLFTSVSIVRQSPDPFTVCSGSLDDSFYGCIELSFVSPRGNVAQKGEGEIVGSNEKHVCRDGQPQQWPP